MKKRYSLVSRAEAWIHAWIRAPHPFFLLALCMIIFSGIGARFLFQRSFTQGIPRLRIGVWILVIIAGKMLQLAFLILPILCAFVGAHGCKNCYWVPTHMPRRWILRWQQQGFCEVPLTYRNAAEWIGAGIGLVTRRGAILTGRVFVYTLLERPLCQISWSFAGGWIAWQWYVPAALIAEEKILFLAGGTTLGMLVGSILSYRGSGIRVP